MVTLTVKRMDRLMGTTMAAMPTIRHRSRR